MEVRTTYCDIVLFFPLPKFISFSFVSLLFFIFDHTIFIYLLFFTFFSLFSSLDSGNTAPDPNSRRSMARFQTYLDRTHAQLSATAQTATPSIIPIPRSSPIGLDRGMDRDRERGERDRGDRDRVGDRDRGDRDRERVERGFTRTLVEVLDTLTCPLEKIGTLLGHNGKYCMGIFLLTYLCLFLSLSCHYVSLFRFTNLTLFSYTIYTLSHTFSPPTIFSFTFLTLYLSLTHTLTFSLTLSYISLFRRHSPSHH